MSEVPTVKVVGSCPDCDFTQNVTVDPGHVAVVVHGYGHTITAEMQYRDDPSLLCRYCAKPQTSMGMLVDSFGACHYECLITDQPKPEPDEWMARRDRAVKRGTEKWADRLDPEARALLESLPLGWGEVLEQWQTCQVLLTDAGVPPGLGAQSGADLDTRIARYAVPALVAIDRIAEAHVKDVDDHGGTMGLCRECGWAHPCPTYVWATSDRDSLACWDPKDDEEHARG